MFRVYDAPWIVAFGILFFVLVLGRKRRGYWGTIEDLTGLTEMDWALNIVLE